MSSLEVRAAPMAPRYVAALLVVTMVLGGCYSWTPRPASELRALQPDSVRQAAAERARTSQAWVEAAHRDPPDGVKIQLTSGEVIRLYSPFSIVESSPGVFQVTDAQTPTRSLALSQVSRVELGQPNTAGSVAILLLIPIAILSVIGAYSLATTASFD